MESNITKSWTVNGTITSKTRDAYFFVDPSPTNKDLYRKVIKRPSANYIMLFGARGAGKSTRIICLREQLFNDYFCIYTTLQSAVDIKDTLSFWASFGKSIQRWNPSLPLIASSSDFADLFSPKNKEQYFQNKEVVMIIDEFDMLCLASTELLDSVLNVLRSLKDGYGESNIMRSFIAVGPFSILKLTGRTLSPFNISDSHPTPPFTQEVIQLFHEYRHDLDERIALDIFFRTNGHAGLTCFCGKQLDEVLMRGRSQVSYSDWITFTIKDLIPNLSSSWATMRRLVEEITRDSAEEFRRMIIKYFLHTTEEQIFEDSHLIKCAEYLAAEGILLQCKGAINVNTFQMASPLIRDLVTWAIKSRVSFRIPSRIPLEGKALNVPLLIATAIKHFDKETMRLAPKITYKYSRNPETPHNIRVPSEACYHFELYSVLSLWLKEEYQVYSQSNTPLLLNKTASTSEKKSNSSRRCDLLLSDGSTRYVIELMASDPTSSFNDHIDQVNLYQKSLDAKYWMVNFFTADQPDAKPPIVVMSEKNHHIRILHVIHDLDWSWASIYLNGEVKSMTALNLVDMESLAITE